MECPGFRWHRDFQHCEPLTGSSLKTVEFAIKDRKPHLHLSAASKTIVSTCTAAAASTAGTRNGTIGQPCAGWATTIAFGLRLVFCLLHFTLYRWTESVT